MIAISMEVITYHMINDKIHSVERPTIYICIYYIIQTHNIIHNIFYIYNPSYTSIKVNKV
jgi:hypothetical protein